MNRHRAPKYLRVSLLSACNLKCSYCRPPGKKRTTITAPGDKVRTAIRFLHGQGIRKVRFTGGEPTLSNDLCGLVSYTKSLNGCVHTAITSNGVLLNSQAKELSAAGLDSANISIDTLDPDKFKILTGAGYLDRVISGIDTAVQYIKRVKLNTVLIRGVNDDEAERLISFADNRGLDIRFIEFMPNRFSAPGDPRFIPSEEIRRRLPWNLKLMPGNTTSAARYYTSASLKIKVGFIDSVSHPFCKGCNRIRLTAEGYLYACLYDSSRIDLFNLLETNTGMAGIEFEKLMRSKRFGGCQGAIHPVTELPSFSAIGG